MDLKTQTGVVAHLAIRSLAGRVFSSIFLFMKRLRIAGLLSCCFLLSSPLWGQSLNFRYYDSGNGLSSSFITAIEQDHQGYLWFGTYEGLSRYDGISFKTFSDEEGLTGIHIVDLCVGADGRLWVGTRDSGVFVYDGHRFTMFFGPTIPRTTEITTIMEDSKGVLWLGTMSGVYQSVDGQSSLVYAEDNLAFNCIVEDPQYGILFGTSRGLFRLVNGKMEDVCAAYGVATRAVWSVARAADGTLLVGATRGVYRLRDNQMELLLPEVREVKTIYTDRRGNTWFSGASGVYKLQGDTLESYAMELGGLDTLAQAIFEDHEGNLWFGSVYGVRMLVNEAFTSYFPHNSPVYKGANCVSVCRDGRIIYVSNDAISLLSGKSFHSMNTI
ncbi:MAG: hypothetical protein FJ220_04935 [Kiritimatiellaceae bacterium]|nr:hypothetical protein [Kiritimatiellaceae bacterium]